MKSICPILLMLTSTFVGCSSQQIYQSTQGWRQSECQKILDDYERARCRATADKDYDAYDKERRAPAGQY